jgi:hypothetical protein
VAQIRLEELIAIIKEHPQYTSRWELEVPAEQALYIEFAKAEPNSVESTVFEAADGHQLVLDRDASGRVRGIEII